MPKSIRLAIQQTLFFILRLLAHWRLARLAAYTLLLTTQRLPTQHDGPRRGQRRYRALIMTRAGFLQDIEESFRGADDFDLIYWPNIALKAFAAAILSPSLDHNYYLSDDPEVEASKQEFRDFLAKMWAHYSALKHVDVALTGNFGYYSEREFAAALEAAGTPFIALHKENVRPPRRVKEYWFALYKERRGKFSGRKILVYNDIERDLEISSGIIDDKAVVVTGMPRLDRIHRWRREQARRETDPSLPQALFFGFSRHDKLTAIQRKPTAGLPGNIEAMEGDWGKLSWDRLCDDTHRAIVEVARVHPDLHMIVKAKGQSRKLGDIINSLNAGDEELPSNLKLIVGGDPFELITQSRVVIGFNTTGLLEAIAAGRPVIVPWFGEAREQERSDLIIDLGDAVEYAQSPEELAERICHYVSQPAELPLTLTDAASQALKKWTGNDDGAAGARVLQAVYREVGRASN